MCPEFSKTRDKCNVGNIVKRECKESYIGKDGKPVSYRSCLIFQGVTTADTENKARIKSSYFSR